MTLIKDLPNYEPKIYDSSAIMQFKQCPRSYQFKIILGYQEKVVQPYFAFGSAYHLFREVLEQEFLKDDATLDGCFEPAAMKAIEYWKLHGTEAPPDSKWGFLNTQRLMLSLKAAWIYWEKEKRARQIVVLASEQAFSLKLPSGIPVGGKADQIVRWNGRPWGRDFKTSSKLEMFYERTLEPNDQFTRYTWAESQLIGEQVQGQIVEVLFNSKKDGPKIVKYQTSRSKWQVDTWVKEHEFWSHMIDLARSKYDLYPANEKSCTFCPYHSVCKMPSESAMVSHLQSYFKHAPWDFQAPKESE